MKMPIIQRMKRSINRRKGEVVLTRDFKDFGSVSSVTAAMKQLVEEGVLYRIGLGVYAKTMRSQRTGRFIPRTSLASLAEEAFEKLGIKFQPGRALRNYAEGKTMQIPVRIRYDVFGRRIKRKLQIGGNQIFYENNKQ